ncbi:MAG: DEAD/DEAH box helicase family protein [Xanthobacteraceae bacterium]
MTLQLRYYQAEAVDAVFDYWNEEPGNPLVDLATGTGKSLVLAELTQRLLAGWGDLRIVIVTHVAELIEQNYLELLGVWPFAPAGIYSAGLGRRDRDAPILFAGIQTVWNKPMGHVDIVMVDEAHLIPPGAAGRYGKWFAALRQTNPDLKIVGLTATPYRLGSGRLDEGDDRLFDRVVYTYGIADGVRDGYLSALSSKPTATAFDMSGVGREGGDYKQSALQAAVDKAAVTRAAVAEIVAKGADRRSWLCFCSGVEHAFHVRDEIRTYGISCETITGETPKDERRHILAEFKAYRLRSLTNNAVLTTGFNHKGVDLIPALRPTLSESLYGQMMGRGTRPLYAPGFRLDTAEERLAAIAAGPKPNCLVLDFAGLVRQHGPVDMIQPKRPGEGKGEAPVKQCPDCEELVHISVMTCPCCGHVFPPNEESKLTSSADIVPILSTADAEWYPVSGRSFREHQSKDPGKPNSVRTDYRLGFNIQKDWLCPEHKGGAKAKADRYWDQHGGARPFPKSVAEWLERADELRTTTEISLVPNGRFVNVQGWRVGPADYVAEVVAPEVTAPAAAHWIERASVWDDDIPF